MSHWGLRRPQDVYAQGSPSRIYKSTSPPLSHSASFSRGHTDKSPNNSSFLIPLLTLPTEKARLFFSEMIKVRRRWGKSYPVQESAGSWAASLTTGHRAGMGLAETSNHHAAQSRNTLCRLVIPEKLPPAKSVQASALFHPARRDLVLGHELPSGEDRFKNKTYDLMSCMWNGPSLIEGPTQYWYSCFL